MAVKIHCPQGYGSSNCRKLMLSHDFLPRGVFINNMGKEKYNQKGKNPFFAGILIGMFGSLASSMFISSFFRIFKPNFIVDLWTLIISGIGFFGVYYWIYKQIKPIK